MPAKIRRIDFSPDEWIAGTVMLSNAERGLYITACALIYLDGGPIDRDHLRTTSADHGLAFNRQLQRLLDLGKLTENGSRIDQERCENELRKARERAENAKLNGRKGGHSKGLQNPGLPRADARPRNHQPSQVKTRSSPQEAAAGFNLRAGDTPPLAAARGDGAAPPAQTEQTGPTVFDDPQLRADAIAALGRCLDAVRGKLPVMDVEATVPPPDPRLVQFRARLQRLNTVASERLTGNTRLQAWETIAEADAFGDPLALSPDMLAGLDAIESLEPRAEAAE